MGWPKGFCQQCMSDQVCAYHKGKECALGCECGRHHPPVVSAERLENFRQWSIGRVVSEETRHKQSLAKKGRTPWNKGLSGYRTGFHSFSSHSRAAGLVKGALSYWRWLVLERDDYTCQVCGVREDVMEADHIISRWERLDLVYAVSNGRALCHECHRKTDTFAGLATRRPKVYQIPLPLVV